MRPFPEVDGLIASWWRAERGVAIGRYLFEPVSAGNDVSAGGQLEDRVASTVPAVGPTVATLEPIRADQASEIFDRPVFIVSAPRAGSTLLAELLAGSDRLWSLPCEMQPMIDGLPPLSLVTRGYGSQILGELDADARTSLAVRACLLSELASNDGVRLLDHRPADQPRQVRLIAHGSENALRIPWLRKVFPDAHFVFLQRDLRQNVSSIVEAWQHPGFISIPDLPGWSRGSWCFLLPKGWERYDRASLTEIAAFQWASANEAIVRELEAVPRYQWTTVDHADLVASPAREIGRICARIGIEPDPELRRVLARPLRFSSTTITPPSPIKWKSNRSFEPALVKGLQPLAGTMRSLRAKAAPTVRRATDRTSTQFSCFVDDLEPVEDRAEVIVAPSLLAQIGSTVPLGLLTRARHRERFLADHPVLWIQDSGFGVWAPLWLRRQQAWLGAHLEPGQPPPSMLTGDLRRRLIAAGALVSPDALAARRADCAHLVEVGRADLDLDRYCLLPSLLPTPLLDAVARYYRAMLDSGEWTMGDPQVEQRHGWHNERLSQFLHHQLVDIASSVAGRPLKPTYAYASAYRGGAELDAHLDREQCDYTLSLMIDEVAPTGGEPWPLWFQSPAGRRSVTLPVGDAVLFRGCELPHWREPASPDHEQVNLLFHFVPSDWAGVMD